MPPTNDDVYVKHKDMHKLMWSALGATVGLLLTIIGSAIGVTWFLGKEINVLQTDVAVIKYQLSQPPELQAIYIDGQRQWQIVLVELPESIEVQQMRERERQHAELIREQLARNQESRDGMQ